MNSNQPASAESSDCQDLKMRILGWPKNRKKPVTTNDGVLGELTLDQRFGSYSGNVKWAGQQVRLNLECESPENPQRTIDVVRQMLHEQDDWQSRVDDLVVEKLLQLKNDTWLEEDEAEVSPTEFLARMSLETISVDADGRFSFYFNDGDLFWGHTITVSGSTTDGPKFAGIEG